jgi:TRAP-type C4-dicarboxylate transport system permease small subunit
MTMSHEPGAGPYQASDTSDAPEARDPGLLGVLTRTTGRFCDYIVLLLVALFGYELVARNLFNAPTGFADQLAAYMLPAISFLALARSLRSGAHVSVDVLTDRISPVSRQMLKRLSLATEILVCVALTVLSVHTVIEAYRDNLREMIGQWVVQEYLPLMAIPIGLALAAWQCARDLRQNLQRPPTAQHNADGA